MKNYKELEVWQKAKSLAVELYTATERFPQVEQFGLTTQTRRAGTSVAANIAEGWGRGSTREYIQFLLIGRGSLMELETHLIVAQELGYLARERLIVFQEQIESIGQMLNGLVRALRARQMAHEPRIPNPGPR